MISTDIIIIGAGPCGLFTVFEAGLLKLRCHIVDVLPQVGGQLTEVYPKKPIYDIPGFPSILAGELIDNLMKQIEPFKPSFTLGERAEKIERTDNNHFILTTHKGTQITAPVIAIAAGLGCFEPKRPPFSRVNEFEDKGIDYMIRNPEKYRDKDVIISGGGDSALDWALYLADVAKSVALVHRRSTFRGHLDSVQKLTDLASEGKIQLITDAEIIGVNGENSLEQVVIQQQEKGVYTYNTQFWIPLFGLSPQLGPICDWGLNIDKKAISVNTRDYSTNVEGIYAIGDINTYDGKLKLILCGFHEATIMVQSAYDRINPDKKRVLKYTTLNGVEAF